MRQAIRAAISSGARSVMTFSKRSSVAISSSFTVFSSRATLPRERSQRMSNKLNKEDQQKAEYKH